ncbi:MAG: 4Fe-4S binding protein [Firmicutes bacterium]|nr:4Fe-4S binding protein [Bacillota bacterium]
MIRKIIKIDTEKCNGCGLCAKACHEGAIGMVNGKAQLLREDYCDGLGDCLPACPVNAITFEEREAPAYDEAAVLAAKAEKEEIKEERAVEVKSRLSQWPVQIKLMPINAPYFEGADILVAADCTAYAYGNFHNDFIKGKITLIGCPKLDATDYSEKLSAMFAQNNIKSVTVTRMQVPCCGGIEMAVCRAVELSGKEIPVEIVTIAPTGEILKREYK